MHSRTATRSVPLNYMVVIFSTNGEEYVSAAPTQWLRDEESMMWPGNKAIERKAIKLNMRPEQDWIKYESVEVVGYYATLKEALDVEKRKQNSSCSETEVRGKGKRKITKNQKYRDDSISPPPEIDEADLPRISTNNYAFPTAEDIMNAKMILENPIESNILEFEMDQITIKPKKIASQPSDVALEHNPSPDDALTVEQHFNISRNPSDVESVHSNSAAGASGISGNSSLDDLALELKQIKKFVTYTMRKVEAIESILVRQNVPLEPQKSLLPNLPLMELIQLRTLEDNLENESIQKELFDILKHTGGSKERDCVNRCLEKIFSNYLGQYCSWTGKKNNCKLSSMKLMTTIKLAVKETFPHITDESFERHVMSWFQHASTRLKREN